MPVNLEGKRLTSIAKGAKRIGTSDRHVRHLMERGLVTRYVVAGLVRVDINELDALVTIEAPKRGDAA